MVADLLRRLSTNSISIKGGSITVSISPTPASNAGTWTLETPSPIPAGWSQAIHTPPPGTHEFSFTFSAASTVAAGSQLCIVDMYNDQDGHFTQQGWLTELLTVIDPSLQIYDMDKSEALPEDAQDQLGSVVGGQMNLKAQTIDGSQIERCLDDRWKPNPRLSTVVTKSIAAAAHESCSEPNRLLLGSRK